MVKILSLQKKPTIKWTKQVECPMCGALLEYTNLDVQQRMCQYNEIDDVITCPNCNKWFCI